MSRSIRSVIRHCAALRPALSIQSASLGRAVPMAHLSTEAMAHASAVNGQSSSSWHGTGAAEFDLRSTVALHIAGLPAFMG